MNKQRFNELIDKYRQGEVSRKEYQELLRFLRMTGIEKELDQALDHHWKGSDQFSEMSFQEADTPSSIEDSISLQHASPPASGATTLPGNNSYKQYMWWGMAASLLVILGLMFYFNGTPAILKEQDIVYQTGFGERQEILLEDGSMIMLNANSRLQWKHDWQNSGMREVGLEGEAFFEVAKQDGIPFTVRTNAVSVEVLGTSFNVDSREEKAEVYLEEGKVNLKLIDRSYDHSNRIENSIIMKPGDKIRYNANRNNIEKTEGQTMITAAAWKSNVLNFKNMKFSEVLNLLRNIYGQSFECSNSELLRTPMYLGVPYSDWEAVRQALELSLNIEFQRVENRRYKVTRIKN